MRGNSLEIGANDRVLTVVPMFHVNGWGLPLAAMLAGADLILPGAFLVRPNIIADLIRTERPTIAAGVPTIWMDLLAFLGAKAREVIQTLKIIATGGAFVAPKFIETIKSYGVRVVQAWGMTGASSMSVISTIPRSAEGSDTRRTYLAKHGASSPGWNCERSTPTGRRCHQMARASVRSKLEDPGSPAHIFPMTTQRNSRTVGLRQEISGPSIKTDSWC